MSKMRSVLELAVPREVALSACHAALGEMGWQVIAEVADTIDAREDPVRLCCHQSPAQSELRVRDCGQGSSVAIETTVPGFGPVSSVHADECQLSLVRQLHKHALALAAQPS
jgi:hypothetical protein